MRQPPGFAQSDGTSAMLHPKSDRRMRAELPDLATHWGIRAHGALESQLRRKKLRRQLKDSESAKPECTCGSSNNAGAGTTSTPAQLPPPSKRNKREWWRLDPNVGDKYRPVEPPATPDPSVVPTPERFVFGWEAPLSPLEQVLQDDVRRLLPNVHKWIVRRAIERAGLKSETDNRPPLPLPEDIAPAETREPEEEGSK